MALVKSNSAAISPADIFRFCFSFSNISRRTGSLNALKIKGNNLAHHLIQSFAPDETTPEQAHKIGRQLADEVLQGKYPYVLTTHIDKGHVHNHIIFCAVDMVNQRKYVSNRQSYAYIRRTSDRLCKEYGLSVVMPGQDRGKSYAEWDAHRKGTSWKAKLKTAFFCGSCRSSYEVKRGKYVSFRAPGQGGSPAAKRWEKPTPKKLSPSASKGGLRSYGIIKQNVDSILRVTPGKEQAQEL